MNEHEREIAEAWREASREEPPPALDAAIRAEAHRAVDARPGRAHRQWRYPAATAATVAVLAFGIARMTSRDAIEPIIVADQAPRQAPATAASTAPEHRTENAANEAAPPPQAAKDINETDAKLAATPRKAPPTGAKTTPVQKPEAARDERFAAAPPASPAAVDRSAAAAPQSPPDAKANDTLRREQESLANEYAAAHHAAEAAASSKMMVAKVPASDGTKAKQAGGESVEAWIARIRDLRARDQLDTAAKEIAKFRETYGDRADALLPPDLRNVAPPRP